MAAAASFGQLKTDKDVVKAPPPETPFRIVVLGDFSGRGSRNEVGSSEEIAERKSFRISRDNFDDIMKKVGVKVRVPGLEDDETFDLTFTSIDGFHPDEIYDQIPKFADLDSDDQTKLMSGILHDPAFQAVEANWRGLYWLLARVKEVKAIQGVVVDLSQAELTADLLGNDDLLQSGLYQMLVAKPAAKIDGNPWALLVGLYTFTMAPDQINALGRVAKVARETVAPFMTAVPVEVAKAGWEMPEEAAPVWEALRKLPEAPMLGLAMPRFLLRQPYGENTKSIDRFSYEECPGPHAKNTYLWGNAALGTACLLAQSFAKEGWAFKSGALLDLPDMPNYVYTDEDDDRVMLLAEAHLARKEGEKIAPLGFMNFVCAKNKDVIQLIRFQSVGLPTKGATQVDLLGQWGQKGAVQLPPTSGKPSLSATATLAGAPPSAKKAAAPKTAPKDEEPDEAPAAASAPEEEMDPELAAMMAALESGGAAEPAPAKEAAPAEDEMDPELAALMAQLEGGGDDAAAAAPAAAPEEEMDPELAALMKQLEGGEDEAAAKVPDDPADAEEMDPELAALMAQLEGGGDETPPAEETPAEKPAAEEEEMDPELAALMKQLEG